MHNGVIVEIHKNPGVVLQQGESVALLELTSREDADVGQEPEVVAYVAPFQGVELKPGMEAQVIPESVREEEYGVMLGYVLSISPYPASPKWIMRVLDNQDLVKELTRDGSQPEAKREKRSRSFILARLSGLSAPIGLAVFAGALLIIPVIAQPGFTKIFIDDILNPKSRDWLNSLLLAMAASLLAIWMLSTIQRQTYLRQTVRSTIAGSAAFINRALRLPHSFFIRNHGGEVGMRNQYVVTVTRTIVEDLTVAAVSLVAISTFAFVMLQYGAALTMPRASPSPRPTFTAMSGWRKSPIAGGSSIGRSPCGKGGGSGTAGRCWGLCAKATRPSGIAPSPCCSPKRAGIRRTMWSRTSAFASTAGLHGECLPRRSPTPPWNSPPCSPSTSG